MLPRGVRKYGRKNNYVLTKSYVLTDLRVIDKTAYTFLIGCIRDIRKACLHVKKGYVLTTVMLSRVGLCFDFRFDIGTPYNN